MKPKTFRIADRAIGPTKKVFVIAEAGVNHNGKLPLALRLINAAKDAGADAVKFQTFKAEQVVSQSGLLATYQRKNIGKEMSQIKMLRQLELKEGWYGTLLRHCKKRGIIFLSAPHGGFASVDLLIRLKLPALKFGSGDLTNIPLLQHAAHAKIPMIISTGMSTLAETKAAISAIRHAGNNNIIALHCTTNYPCPLDEVNLASMVTMIRTLDVFVGYSDHTLGDEVPVAATVLGACVIEKHLTLDHAMHGPDHAASMEPKAFKEMIQRIRHCAELLGSPIKRPNKSEYAMIATVRKSIISTAPIARGERFTAKNLGIKRPGTGLPPIYYKRIIGKKATRDIHADMLLTQRDYA